VRLGKNQLGGYGAWADERLGEMPGALSLRNGAFADVPAWRRKARARVWELLAAPALPQPKARLVAHGVFDGAAWERLEWRLPWGPKTEAVFLKPEHAKPGERLPAILGLHDHGARKYFGWRKIAGIGGPVHPFIRAHQAEFYGGRSWANALVKRGYAVLIHDTFLFGSRRIALSDVPPAVARGTQDPDRRERTDDIVAYNQWAILHEHTIAMSLFSAGTTWPALFLRDDQAALSILCARPDVDARRVGCGGLSGGGLRTMFLSGLDARIRACACVGFFTTWRDLMLYKSHMDSWMSYVPHLPRDLDFSEIIGLRAPLPTLVMNCDEDHLFTLSEVRKGSRMLGDVYRRAGAPEAFRFSLHKGGHVFSLPMQREAFDWFDHWLT
jgi:hypothetical protein